MLCSTVPPGVVQQRFLTGLNPNQVIAQETNTAAGGDGKFDWLLTNRQGSVTDVFWDDEQGNLNMPTADYGDHSDDIGDHIAYDPYGNMQQSDPDDPPAVGYTGYQIDSSGLYYAGARYYDPATGRFLNEDPAGFSAGDTNLYRYVGNNPTDATDPTGLSAVYGFGDLGGYNSFAANPIYDLGNSPTIGSFTSPGASFYSTTSTVSSPSSYAPSNASYSSLSDVMSYGPITGATAAPITSFAPSSASSGISSSYLMTSLSANVMAATETPFESFASSSSLSAAGGFSGVFSNVSNDMAESYQQMEGTAAGNAGNSAALSGSVDNLEAEWGAAQTAQENASKAATLQSLKQQAQTLQASLQSNDQHWMSDHWILHQLVPLAPHVMSGSLFSPEQTQLDEIQTRIQTLEHPVTGMDMLAATGQAALTIAAAYAGATSMRLTPQTLPVGVGPFPEAAEGGVIATSYGDLSRTLPEGFQANHLNQNAVYGSIIPRNEGLANAMQGDAITELGTPHYSFHQSMETLWEPYRPNGALFGQTPSNAEYGQALEQALQAGGYSPAQATNLASQAAAQRAAYGLSEAAPVPRIPGRINQVKP